MRINVLLTVHKQKKVKVSLKNNEYFVGVLLGRTTYDNGRSIVSLSHYHLEDFEMDYLIDDDFSVTKQRLSIEQKNITDIELYEKVGGDYCSNLNKLQKQCYWPVDLEKKINKSARKKFMLKIQKEENHYNSLPESISNGFYSAFDTFKSNEELFKENYLESLLMRAIKNNRVEIVKWLLEHPEIYPVKKDSNDRAKMMYEACKKGNLAIIQLLVKNGFDINDSYYVDPKKPSYEYVPLHALVKGYFKEPLEWLQAEGLFVVSPSVFKKAISQSSSNLTIDILLKLIPKRKKQEFLNYGLLGASAGGGFHLVEDFLKMGADIDFVDTNEMTAVCYALSGYQDYSIEKLVEAGADINLGNMGYEGQIRSPLQYAKKMHAPEKYIRILKNIKDE